MGTFGSRKGPLRQKPKLRSVNSKNGAVIIEANPEMPLPTLRQAHFNGGNGRKAEIKCQLPTQKAHSVAS